MKVLIASLVGVSSLFAAHAGAQQSAQRSAQCNAVRASLAGVSGSPEYIALRYQIEALKMAQAGDFTCASDLFLALHPKDETLRKITNRLMADYFLQLSETGSDEEARVNAQVDIYNATQSTVDLYQMAHLTPSSCLERADLAQRAPDGRGHMKYGVMVGGDYALSLTWIHLSMPTGFCEHPTQ